MTQQVTDALAEYHYADAARVLYDFAWDEFCSFYVEMVKGRLQDESQRPVAQRVLAHTLDTLLRLLHPMIPFLTEEVWQRLGEVAPRARHRRARAGGREHHDRPVARVRRRRGRTPEIEAHFARFQEVLRAVRDIRARQNVPPKTPLAFSVRCDAADGRAAAADGAVFRRRWPTPGRPASGPDVEPPAAERQRDACRAWTSSSIWPS